MAGAETKAVTKFRGVVTRWNTVKASVTHPGRGDLSFSKEDCLNSAQPWVDSLRGRIVEYELEQRPDGRLRMINVRLIAA